MRAALLATSRRRPRVSDLPAALGERRRHPAGQSETVATLPVSSTRTPTRSSVAACEDGSLDASTAIGSAPRYSNFADRHLRPGARRPARAALLQRRRAWRTRAASHARRSVVGNRAAPGCPRKTRAWQLCRFQAGALRHARASARAKTVRSMRARPIGVRAAILELRGPAPMFARATTRASTRRVRSFIASVSAHGIRQPSDADLSTMSLDSSANVSPMSLDQCVGDVSTPYRRRTGRSNVGRRKVGRNCADIKRALSATGETFAVCASSSLDATTVIMTAPRYSNLRNAARTSGRATRAAILEPPQRGTHVRPRDPRRDTRTSATRRPWTARRTCQRCPWTNVSAMSLLRTVGEQAARMSDEER
jgi:hypothetical protein